MIEIKSDGTTMDITTEGAASKVLGELTYIVADIVLTYAKSGCEEMLLQEFVQKVTGFFPLYKAEREQERSSG